METQGSFAVRFFQISVAVFGTVGLCWGTLYALFSPFPLSDYVIPPAFVATTLLLAVTSAALQCALHQVRIERQRRFRRWLLAALAAGTMFVGIQGYGVVALIQNRNPAEALTGAVPFVFVFAALHGSHVAVALLFLIYVTLRGLADRYDHEYYWGVTVCTIFWHALGVAWLFILAVIVIAM